MSPQVGPVCLGTTECGLDPQPNILVCGSLTGWILMLVFRPFSGRSLHQQATLARNSLDTRTPCVALGQAATTYVSASTTRPALPLPRRVTGERDVGVEIPAPT